MRGSQSTSGELLFSVVVTTYNRKRLLARLPASSCCPRCEIVVQWSEEYKKRLKELQPETAQEPEEVRWETELQADSPANQFAGGSSSSQAPSPDPTSRRGYRRGA